jgi:type II secretory ATPase GspE/PulE/Tfp pilus assembly ATPase PilB-like protein
MPRHTERRYTTTCKGPGDATARHELQYHEESDLPPKDNTWKSILCTKCSHVGNYRRSEFHAEDVDSDLSTRTASTGG